MNLNYKINKLDLRSNIIIDLFKYLPNKRKLELFILLVLSLFNGVSELFNISIFQEFLLLISNSKGSENIIILTDLIKLFKIQDESHLIFFTGVIYIISLIISTFIKTYILYLTANISCLIGEDFSYLALKKFLLQNYEYHLKQNSNKIITLINIHIEYSTAYIINLIECIYQIIIIVFLITFLIKLDFKLALIFSSSIVSFYLLLSFILKKRIKNNGKIISESSNAKNKSLLETIGHIKEIILTRNQSQFISRFMKYENKFRIKNAENIFLPRLPRYILESFALTIFVLISLISSLDNNLFLSNFIALLGTFALASQKLLSSVQASFSNWSSMLSRNESLSNVLKILKLSEKEFNGESTKSSKKSTFSFNNSITLSGVSYQYIKNKNLNIKNINLEIIKGEKIGIIGKTGSGKTTLLNLLISLLNPTFGNILIDGKDLHFNQENINQYRSLVSYVPQNIYLSDTSIKNNITFGLNENKVDYKKFKKVIQITQLKDWINNLPLKENTFIGENGLSISGGQRQRLAIARSLYSNSQILILDEATSAMDSNTEKMILKSIEKVDKNITLLMVAHRLNTLINCDRVIELENGSIKDIYNNIEFIQKFINSK